MDIAAFALKDSDAVFWLRIDNFFGQLNYPFSYLNVLFWELNDDLIKLLMDDREHPHNDAFANDRPNNEADDKIVLEVINDIDCDYNVG